MNEFYEVEFYGEGLFFFKNKDNAFSFLWQKFLNANAEHFTDSELAEFRRELYEEYFIDCFGHVRVVGFED